MKTSMARFCALTALVLSPMPPPAGADAQYDGGVPARLKAAAHVDFKIVIPRVLSLELLAADAASGWPRVAIGSNGRTVSLAATGEMAGGQRRDSIIGAGVRSAVAAQSTCSTLGHGAARLVCTVSVP